MSGETFHESHAWKQPIRDLGLRIEGTQLEPLIAELQGELENAGITRVRPRFYLSTEWGVPFETVAVAIPFYLVSDDLTRVHEAHAGHVEGADRDDILRYLRHEMGHVVNYAYRLYDTDEWTSLFGSIDEPYSEDYRPAAFSRHHVRHLPGWYAQMHPDEDWAETFAVWLTPGADWRSEHAEWPEALRKLEWCDRTMARLRDVDPDVTDDSLDEDVGEVTSTLEDFYAESLEEASERAPGLDGALRALFGQLPRGGAEPRAASDLITRLRPALRSEGYRWTGHFPERTNTLVTHLAERAKALGLAYDASQETTAIVAITTFVTALAMTWVTRGDYSP